MTLQLNNEVAVKRLKIDATNYQLAAGTSAVTSEILDMQAFDGVRFILAMGAITSTAVTSAKIQEGDASNMSDAADLAGTKVDIADTDDNKIVVMEVYRPRKRYVRVAISRGTANAVGDSLVAELYDSRAEPVAADATAVAVETHVSPAEGTA